MEKRIAAALLVVLAFGVSAYAATYVADVVIHDLELPQVSAGESAAYYLKYLNSRIVLLQSEEPAPAPSIASAPVSAPETEPPAETLTGTAKAESVILSRLNEVRQSMGRAPLVSSQDLVAIAKAHSEYMGKGAGLVHSGYAPENVGMTPTGNVIGCGYVSTAEDAANCIFSGWMASGGHYANMINQSYLQIGIGIYFNGSIYYATQDFR